MARLVRQRPMTGDAELQSSRGKPTDTLNDYAERLAKYIPAEILGAYIVFNNVVEGVHSPIWLIVTIYLSLVVLNSVYLWNTAGEVRKKGFQIWISNVAFLVWSYAIGGAVWAQLRDAIGADLRHPLSVTMFPVLVSLALGLFSPDGLSMPRPPKLRAST